MMTGAEYPSPLTTPSNHPDQRRSLQSSPALPSEPGFPDNVHATTGGPPVCLGCSQPILDQFIIQVQGHMWHSRCLRCCVCQTVLSHTCYSGNSQLYCQEDFFRLFGASCSSCNGVIAPSEVVRRAHDNVYHLNCFRCHACRSELNTGDEFYLCVDGQLYCKVDYMALKSKDQGQDENANPNGPVPHRKEEKDTVLLQYYNQNAKPKRDTVEKIAIELEIEPSAVRSWFRQQRAKDKRKGNNREKKNEEQSNTTNRVHAPPGGYPLPIVNKAITPGQLPESANHPANQHLNSTHIPTHMMGNQSQWTTWDELWSSDFVPPNVDLQPDHLKNGEVVRFHPHSTSVPISSQSPLLVNSMHLSGGNPSQNIHHHCLHHQQLPHHMDNTGHNMSGVTWVS